MSTKKIQNRKIAFWFFFCYNIIERKRSMKDFNGYIKKLHAALQEKLFFIDKIDWYKYDLVIDFGCATGILLNEVHKVAKFNRTKCIGYDISKEMLDIARSNYTNLDFTDDLEYVKKLVAKSNRAAIIFSTVLHEIGGDNNTWKEIYSLMSSCNTVIIRDMIAPTENAPVDKYLRKYITSKAAEWQVQAFERKYGRIHDTISLYRFLLMNEFVDNYISELEEDYFSVPWNQISIVLKQTHSAIYQRLYTLPYRKNQVKELFNYDMILPTHKEIIFIKNKS